MRGHASRWLTLVALEAALLGSCDDDPAGSGAACDPCGEGEDIMALFHGVPSTCGSGLECVAATVFLPGPGVCIRRTGSTTCQGTITDSGGTRHNECTYTPGEQGYEVSCH